MFMFTVQEIDIEIQSSKISTYRSTYLYILVALSNMAFYVE